MAVQAYVLVQTEPGRAGDVARSALRIEGVLTADDVTGPYDVILRTEADDVDALARLVSSRVQALPGITRTLTCPVVQA
ncbi:Lrp/AsnC family transcriptional regulator [Nocardioides yefusunii]|uniref:Lrp/AsnC family transcriptional regulator n=1 Tax=Nocardioides yefusunii TaxID=2500546 RepID=A0ABW1QXW1_9ACTN|nr:Lrp/AsnC ligand binding domain-containing protein [Nocardioides yefusunii]